WTIACATRTTMAAIRNASTTAPTVVYRTGGITGSQALDLQVVGVVAGEVGADAHENRRGAGRDEAALDELYSEPRAGRVEVVADFRTERHDAPVEGQSARGLLALGG